MKARHVKKDTRQQPEPPKKKRGRRGGPAVSAREFLGLEPAPVVDPRRAFAALFNKEAR